MTNKFIRIVDAADDAGMWPLENLLHVSCAGDSKLSLLFKSSKPLYLGTIGTSGAAATKAYDEVIFSITADAEAAVMAEIAHLINAGPHNSGVIDLGNDVTGVYPTGITAVDSILLAVS
tara:strand:+ start:661 stop:1017 length:357 start_codon:yes stop_codon:yes gene_type:complete